MQRLLKPSLSRPRDFEAFWDKTAQALKQVPPDATRRELPRTANEAWALYELSFASLGGVRISAYLLVSAGTDTRPLVIHSHGYGSACEIRWDWARRGVNVLGVDIRGHGRSRAALSETSPHGYVLTGIDSPEHYVIRGAVCDFIRAAEVGRSELGTRMDRLVFVGSSFAGGLALMAESVSPMADLLVISVPTFGWSEGRQFFVRAGSGAEINRYLAQRPESTEDLMVILRYFDPVNHADRVRCPTLVGLGLEDEVVPAHTVYAIANHLSGPNEIVELPVSHSDHPDEQLWERFETRWLDLATQGLDDDFGSEIRRFSQIT